MLRAQATWADFRSDPFPGLDRLARELRRLEIPVIIRPISLEIDLSPEAVTEFIQKVEIK